jgi:hypothetical protein
LSYEAVSWALAQEISHSSAKFVLVVMAHHATRGSWESWLSVAKMAESTGQDRKTVMANLARLQQMGFIVDTKKRVGETKQIPVFLLNGAKNGTVSEGGNEPDSSTENGTVGRYQNRDSYGDETVPIFPSNSTVFPGNSTVFSTEQYRFSLETVPKTGHGIDNLKSKDKSKGKSKETREEFPGWIPMDAWEGFVEMRKKIKKPLTDTAERLAIKALDRLMQAGHSPRAVLEQSTLNCWQGLFEVKGAGQRTNGNRDSRDEFNARENARAKELLFGSGGK